MAPIALIGTALAFVIGFQNNSAYGRIWEVRKIWGGVVNTSRTFGMFVQELFTLQGKSERIKNFPYPRHFATLNNYFMWVFVLILPIAIIPQFAEIGQEISKINSIFGNYFVWLAIPFYVTVVWIFHTMEKIGRTGENPFEGSANDVSISTITRNIEIDLRQNLAEENSEIPEQFPIIYDTQM